MSAIVRVLIVDDSAFVRKVVREILSRSPSIEVVGTARDGEEALEMVQIHKPDVVTCDLIMPRMDGVAFVRAQMARHPLPILVLTATPEDGEQALLAMEAGAVDIVQKPTALANEQLFGIREELVEKIKALGQRPLHASPTVETPPPSAPTIAPISAGRIRIVAIGISTGGPQALRFLLPQFPAEFPVPIAIVLHMPVGYTEMFAARLNEISQLEVVEAKPGVEIRPGRAVLAQAGKHLVLHRDSGNCVTAELSLQPIETPHRPSVDVLFQSAADIYRNGVLGVIMTGMGEDGKQGAAWIKSQGGSILTESEESCVIYGMPRSVVEAGLSDASVPLNKMVEAIMKHL